MSYHQSPSESVSDQARVWFSRLQADDVTDAERVQFKRWYQENQQHAQAYDNVRRFWEMLKIPAEQVQAKVTTETTPAPLFSTLHGSSDGAKKSTSTRAASYGVITLMLVILLFNPLLKQFQNWQSNYHTNAGEQLTVALSDGSQVILNTDTALKVAFVENERRIQLLHGEAYFKVAHNKIRPFIVSHEMTRTQAVGTTFTVKDSGHETQVLVSEGTVKVSAHDSDDGVLVHINQQVDYQHEQFGKVNAANVFEALAWQRGQLIFTQQPLQQVIAEINRYHPGKIVLMNPALKQRVVSGVFDTTDPNAAIDALKATLKLTVLNFSGRLVLLY